MANFDDEDEVQAGSAAKSTTKQSVGTSGGEATKMGETHTTTVTPKAHTDVIVTISEKKKPIVVLFGPPACGKTMTLVRLSRYLKNEASGYEIKPIRDFRPATDTTYQQLCDNFFSLLNADLAAGGNDLMNFMLVSVSRGAGDQICQLLEAPGELYFDPNKPDKDPEATAYLNKIINSPNKKIYVIMLEPNWRSEELRRAYVDRIKHLKKKRKGKDRFILLGNKVDKADEFIKTAGNVNESGFRTFLSNQYDGLFKDFKEQRPIINFFKPYNCEFVPFQTGTYSQSTTGKMVFTEGDNAYPKNLWDKILKCAGRRK